MRILRRRSILLSIVVLSLGILSNNTLAASRNCTSAEKQQANEQLRSIADDTAQQTAMLNNHMPFGVHTNTDAEENERVLVQSGYVLKHDDDLRTALWVAYRLTNTDLQDAVGKDRVNCFRQDPRLTYSQTATPADYKEPIYDQGHMANDADLKDNLIEQVNTYIMSNMSPQHCRFNRGIWLSLESLTREWAKKYNTIYVTSGAIFDRNHDGQRDNDDQAERMLSNNGKQRVAVPSHYYKVIMRQEGNEVKSITFLLKNTNIKHGRDWNTVKPHVIDSVTVLGVVELKAGLRLFPDMDRAQLNQQLSEWDLSTNASNLEGSCN